MKVLVVYDDRVFRTPDGRVWTNGPFTYKFWCRYLDVFDVVQVVTRVLDVHEQPERSVRADGENVLFVSVPYYVGGLSFVRNIREIIHTLQYVIHAWNDAIIFRVPSALANLAIPWIINKNRVFALEVVGDPWDVFSPGAVLYPWPVRVLARLWFTLSLKMQLREAAAVSYVTKFALLRRYPPRNTAYITNFSDVCLSSEWFVPSAHRQVRTPVMDAILITVGSLEHLYKGVDILIDAVAILNQEGIRVRLHVVGDGRCRSLLEKRCRERGVEHAVRFLGQLPPGEPIMAQLDQADLFVLASRQEGLPRAMLEAMARGLPCIGTTVGGIPELLPPEDLVPPNNAIALASKIREVLSDPGRIERMSRRNLEKAKEYSEENLRNKRCEFYNFIKEITEIWQRGR